MKHKLLPAMIGAVLAGGMGAVQADITVFGHLDTAVVSHDADPGFINYAKRPTSSFPRNMEGDSRSDNIDDLNFKCTTCSIGFKGSEDLGNGLKVIFKLDFQFNMFSRDKTAFTDRDQWLGLKGNFGQVRWGSISTSYKSHGAMIDPLYRTAAQGRDNGMQSWLHSNAGEEGEGRATHTVRWDSPNWNGIKVTAHYTLDDSERDGIVGPGNLNGEEDDDAYGIGGQYTNGGILVFADYLTNNSDDTNNPTGDLTAWKVGGKYTLNNFAVMAQYEDIEDQFTLTGLDSGKQSLTQWHIAGSYTMGNNMIYLGYGSAEEDNIFNVLPLDSVEQTAITLAGVHKLSKRTSIYAAYTAIEQDNDTLIDAVLTSELHSSYGPLVNGADRDSFAVGMKHKF